MKGDRDPAKLVRHASPGGRAIGDVCVLQARWEGELPEPGHYLRTKFPHAKYSYKIVAIEPLKSIAVLPGVTRAKFIVERCAPIPPAGAVVWAWAWNARRKVGKPGAFLP